MKYRVTYPLLWTENSRREFATREEALEFASKRRKNLVEGPFYVNPISAAARVTVEEIAA